MEKKSASLACYAGNSTVNSPHKGQWRGVLMFSLISAWINDCVTNREAGDLRCHRAHYDVFVMVWLISAWFKKCDIALKEFCASLQTVPMTPYCVHHSSNNHNEINGRKSALSHTCHFPITSFFCMNTDGGVRHQCHDEWRHIDSFPRPPPEKHAMDGRR